MPSVFTPFKQQLTKDRVQNQVQQNVAAVVTSLQSSAIGAGQLVSYKPLAAVPGGVPFTVQHNLGRIPIGIIPTLSSQDYANLYGIYAESSTPTMSTELIAEFNIPAGQTISFWVF